MDIDIAVYFVKERKRWQTLSPTSFNNYFNFVNSRFSTNTLLLKKSQKNLTIMSLMRDFLQSNLNNCKITKKMSYYKFVRSYLEKCFLDCLSRSFFFCENYLKNYVKIRPNA